VSIIPPVVRPSEYTISFTNIRYV